MNRDDREAENKYWGLFNTKYFYEIAINASVMKLARDIRQFYFADGIAKQKAYEQVMDTGDAIHLATAIINEVSEFHTRDDCKRKGRVPLLSLHEISPGGLVAGKYELKL